jgi:hypothetical protein
MSSPLFFVPDIEALGVQPYGASPASPVAISLSTLTGSFSLPARPTSGLPTTQSTIFLAQFTAAITGAITLSLPVPHSPPIAGDYLPGDIVEVLTTPTTNAAHTVAVSDAGGPTTLATMPATLTSGGQIIAQLNAAGTHWTLLSQGGF